jgi:hypothetical protein
MPPAIDKHASIKSSRTMLASPNSPRALHQQRLLSSQPTGPGKDGVRIQSLRRGAATISISLSLRKGRTLH